MHSPLLIRYMFSPWFDGLTCCPTKQPKQGQNMGVGVRWGDSWIVHANLTCPLWAVLPGGRFQLQDLLIGSEGSGESRFCLALKVPEAELGLVFPCLLGVWLGKEVVLGATPSAKLLWVGAFSWLNWFGFWSVIQVGTFLGGKVTYLSSFPQAIVGLEQFQCGFLRGVWWKTMCFLNDIVLDTQ